jgi:hypothetical protein
MDSVVLYTVGGQLRKIFPDFNSAIWYLIGMEKLNDSDKGEVNSCMESSARTWSNGNIGLSFMDVSRGGLCDGYYDKKRGLAHSV